MVSVLGIGRCDCPSASAMVSIRFVFHRPELWGYTLSICDDSFWGRTHRQRWGSLANPLRRAYTTDSIAFWLNMPRCVTEIRVLHYRRWHDMTHIRWLYNFFQLIFSLVLSFCSCAISVRRSTLKPSTVDSIRSFSYFRSRVQPFRRSRPPSLSMCVRARAAVYNLVSNTRRTLAQTFGVNTSDFYDNR